MKKYFILLEMIGFIFLQNGCSGKSVKKEPIISAIIIQNASEKDKIKYIIKKPFYISYLTNPNEDIQLAAVRVDGRALEFIKNPTELVKEMALKENPHVLKFIVNPSFQLKTLARNSLYVNSKSFAFKPSKKSLNLYSKIPKRYVRINKIFNPLEYYKLYYVNKNGLDIRYLVNPSSIIKELAINNNPNALFYINTTNTLVKNKQLVLQSKKGSKQMRNVIKYIKNPTEEAQMFAVKKNANSIQYIKNATAKVQLLAIKKGAISYIVNPANDNIAKKIFEAKHRSKIYEQERENESTRDYPSSNTGNYSSSSSSCTKVWRTRCTYIGGRRCIEVSECY